MPHSASPLRSGSLRSVRAFVMAVAMHQMGSAALAATCAYIANENDGTITVIDTATNTVTDTLSVGGSPTAVAATADGARVYVTNTLPDAVAVLNASTGMPTDNIPLPQCAAALCGPQSLAIATDGRAYVPSPIDDGSHVLSVVDTATNAVTESITLQSGAAQRGGGVGVTVDGHRACVSGYLLKPAGAHTDAVLYSDVVDTTTKGVTSRTTNLGPITTVDDFLAVARTAAAVTPGDVCYIADGFSGNVAVVELAGNTLMTEIPLPHSDPTGLAISADGRLAYVSGGTGAGAPTTLDEGQIFVIDTMTNSLSATIRNRGRFFNGVALSPDDTFAITTDRDGHRAFVINTSDNRPTASIPVGSGPSGVAVAPVAGGCPTRAPCAGDCNRDGVVTVDEMIRMVNIALRSTPASDCPVGDLNHDGKITVDEILGAAHIALRGCPAP